jgi:hypothetical protein
MSNKRLITSEKICPRCNVKHSFELPPYVTIEQYNEAIPKLNGNNLFEVFSFITHEQKELLLTGACQLAFEEFFKEITEGFEVR